ncbi:MAG: hypothetical protein S4CHLAM123_10760 [Chlamydiales bacterium]|nr:hypothetical protein [Chlamydiales bacterium]
MNPLGEQILGASLLTHYEDSSPLKVMVDQLTKKIRERGELPHVTVDRQLEILNQLADFPLGQFLIQNKGLNGYWTNYVLTHPSKRRESGLNLEGQHFSDLEDFILNRAPTVLATQERFVIFQEEIQKHLQEGVVVASVPCGLMSDLLMLDYSQLNTYQIIGVDRDSKAIQSIYQNIPINVEFGNIYLFEEDAWELNLKNKADVITSNGLNIYESDDQKVTELYSQFLKNLKPGGVLISSFLTPPPGLSVKTEWKMSDIDQGNALLQKIIFADILDASWQKYRSTILTQEQLEQAGFVNIQILSGRANIFPTMIARAPK